MTSHQKYDDRHFNFLLSNWYSGATVLSILLDNHKLMTCNGETFPYDGQSPHTLKCSCGEKLIDCEFYNFAAKHFFENEEYIKRYFYDLPMIYHNRHLRRVFRSFRRFSMLRDSLCYLTPGCINKIKRFIRLHDDFFELACQFNKSSVYIDGTKSIRRVELFAQYAKKPIRLIHNIRDGRKFVASYIRNHQLNDDAIPSVAQKWVGYIDMIDTLKKRHPNIQIKEIRHEDLCNDKVSTIKEICAFFEIEYDQDIFDIKNDANYHLLGNDMRHKFDGTIIEKTSWRKSYTDETYEMTTKILKPYLARYNYL